MNKAQKNLLKALKEIGVSHYKDMTFEVQFFQEAPQIKQPLKKKENNQEAKHKSIEDDIKELTESMKIPLLDTTV